MSKTQVVNEIHRNVRKNFPRRHVDQKGIDDLWQADLIDMQFVSDVNKNTNFILVVIDVFSKYVWTLPVKRKTKELVSQAFQSLIEKTGRSPVNLQTDWGTEFYNNCFKKVTTCYNINHYSTYSTKKASIVERLIRTLKSKLFKKFSLKGNYIWTDNTLDSITYEYNHTVHKTIKLSPVEVNKNNEHLILKRYRYLHSQFSSPSRKQFKLGDYVRISKYKGSFEKGYTPNWSTEIFQIVEVKNTIPETYLLKDSKNQFILGGFYSHELQRVKYPDVYLIERVIKRKGKKVFVKWLGLSSAENSWIDITNVIK